MIVSRMLVSMSLLVSLCKWTVSKALDMSSAMVMVRFGGLRVLNPCVITLLMWCSAVVVDLCCLNPC